ncbi:hypothetical protein MMSR116_06025 [Methylobacterium mesophilicum SR1.6/6]|uniref:Uncharacterized protein n=1 Tax=Methylobacterium mesophilicum SR1.6/6 TaxID=908290 RepID=A0A6B9FEL7_9HYPH|nr:hypothetical protein [Methylobacterium mesophilicum]QGY01511.1 hypothetical protein MMSR116_06025 [Methylobacterium mesophilicum SR1.6/6]
MHRCPAEEAEVLTAFREWLQERPRAGFLVGTVDVGTPEDGYSVQIGHVDCCPVSLVAAASELLETASVALLRRPDVRPILDLVCAIERARAALDFTIPAEAH